MDSMDDEDCYGNKTNLMDGNEKAASLTEQMNKVLMERLNTSDSTTKVKEDSMPVQQRKLFGPPTWNPEQLTSAIKAVENGASVTSAARNNGIPRTTLVNKLYGRKRRRPCLMYDTTTPISSSTQSIVSKKTTVQESSSLTHLIGSENEKVLAEYISKQKQYVDSFAITKSVYDLVKFFACEKGVIIKHEEELHEWVQFFFLRYPAAQFTLWNTESYRGLAEESKETLFAEFVIDASKVDPAEEVKRKLFDFMTHHNVDDKNVCVDIHLMTWYAFLVSKAEVKDYFLDNLKWPATILEYNTNFPDGDDVIKHALTSIIMERRSLNSMIAKRVKLITVESTESPTQVRSRRKYDVSIRPTYDNITRTSLDYSSSNDDNFETLDTNNISSTSHRTSTSSLGQMLAKEGLQAVERKISTADIKYFMYRYENPHLEEAYRVWKNLKDAVHKTGQDNSFAL